MRYVEFCNQFKILALPFAQWLAYWNVFARPAELV